MKNQFLSYFGVGLDSGPFMSEMFDGAPEVFLQSSNYIYINSMAIFVAENFSSSTSTSFKKR